MNSSTTGIAISDRYFTQTPVAGWGQTSENEVSTPHVQGIIKISKDKSGVHPKIYFKYLKIKLSVLENRFFKKRMEQLEKMADEYAAQGQEALSEECIKQFLVIMKESAVMACGYKKFLTQEHVDKYRYKLRGESLKITPLKNFTRPLPKRVVDRIKSCMEKKLFDDYEVFHLDNLGVGETEKEKIEKKERDPIVFGKIEYSDKYYFIIDWTDEFDDLRLADMVKKLSLEKEEMTLKPKIEMNKGGK